MQLTMTSIGLAVLLLLAPLTTEIRAQAPTSGQPRQAVEVRFTMGDQFDTQHDLGAYRGDVVVMIYGDRASSDANKTLGELLHVQFHPQAKGLPPAQAQKAPPAPLPGLAPEQRSPNVHVLPVAVIGKVPNVVKGVIRSQFKRGASEVPVWLDFEDRMKTTFGMTSEVPNVVILDSQGRLRYRLAGEVNQQHYQRLTQVIDQLRKEAAGVAQ
ncbi:TlpA family protein disulfide reductase [Tuwongella immobilis]|nr:hypothetical protein [Tuwongella immobilis]